MKMRAVGLVVLLVLSVLFADRALGQPGSSHVLEGRLVMQWGDPQPGDDGLHHSAGFNVELATEDGVRFKLDPDSALDASEDLYALFNAPVAVELDETEILSSSIRPLQVRSIEPLAGPYDLQAARDITGQQKWAFIACKFKGNNDEPRPVSYFEESYSNDSGMLGHYWQEVSYSKMNINGSSVTGWYSLPQTRSYYVNGSADLNALFRDCTAAASDVDFNEVIGIEMAFNDELDGAAWGGGLCETVNGTYGCWRAAWYPPWGFENLAVRAHEMGHGFGLPHANNSDEDDDPYDNPWDVMSDAWFNATSNSNYGILPKHISIYSRDRLGWVDSSRQLDISTDGSWSTLLRFAEHDAGPGTVQIRIYPADHPVDHYYVLESREQTGIYDGMLGTRRGLNGTAVIVHEVVEGRYEPAWSMDARVPPADRSDNRESMFKVGDSFDITPDTRLTVTSQTSEGFWVSIAVGNDDGIFADRFE